MTDSQRISRLRQRLRAATGRYSTLVQGLMAERGPVLKGTFQLHGTRCGKPNCKCTQGALHRTAVLAFTDEGKRRNIYVRPPDRTEVQRRTERYRRFRKSRAELNKLHGEILRLADELLKALLVPYEPTAGGHRSEDPSGHGRSQHPGE